MIRNPATAFYILTFVARVFVGGALSIVALTSCAPTTPEHLVCGDRNVQSEALHVPGLKHVFRLTPGIISGSEPRGESALRALRDLGVRTLLSVDGARPDVETARRLGLRYAHVPIGYDRLGEDAVLAIAAIARDLPGPLYVHCHHGQHRGPAAAAIACRLRAGWSAERASHWLRRVGTSPRYRGLHASVREFRAPSAGVLEGLAEHVPESASVPPLVEAMVEIERRREHLALLEENGFRSTAVSPDLRAAHEALQLEELFRELARASTESSSDPPSFTAQLRRAAERSARLRRLLETSETEQDDTSRRPARDAFRDVEATCVHCHDRYRDSSTR